MEIWRLPPVLVREGRGDRERERKRERKEGKRWKGEVGGREREKIGGEKEGRRTYYFKLFIGFS